MYLKSMVNYRVANNHLLKNYNSLTKSNLMNIGVFLLL